MQKDKRIWYKGSRRDSRNKKEFYEVVVEDQIALPSNYLIKLQRLVMIPGWVWNPNNCNSIPVILAEWGIKTEIILAYWKIKLYFLYIRDFRLWFICTILIYPKVLKMIMSDSFVSLVGIAIFLQGTSHFKIMSNNCLKILWLLFPAKYRGRLLSRVLGVLFIMYPQTCLPLLSWDYASRLLTPLLF